MTLAKPSHRHLLLAYHVSTGYSWWHFYAVFKVPPPSSSHGTNRDFAPFYTESDWRWVSASFPNSLRGDQGCIGVQKSERWRQTDSTEINMMDHKIIPRFHVWKFQRNTPNIQAMGATGSVPTVAKGFSINFPLMSCFHGKCQGCYGYRHFPCILREVPGSKQNCGHILLRVATLVHAWCIIILHKAVESTSFQGFFSNKLADLL